MYCTVCTPHSTVHVHVQCMYMYMYALLQILGDHSNYK